MVRKLAPKAKLKKPKREEMVKKNPLIVCETLVKEEDKVEMKNCGKSCDLPKTMY